jgi:carbonic anhydrase
MDHSQCPCHAPESFDRRRFISLASAAGGAALLALGLPRFALADGDTDALMLSCMDYRLVDKTLAYMNANGLEGRYDHVVLAGASLGAVTSKFPDWGHTFRQHLDIAIALHHIHRVIVIDHRDCGAYKTILGKDYAPDPVAETKIHAEMLHRLRHQILAHHAKLEVSLGLMALDGKVEPIA